MTNQNNPAISAIFGARGQFETTQACCECRRLGLPIHLRCHLATTEATSQITTSGGTTIVIHKD